MSLYIIGLLFHRDIVDAASCIEQFAADARDAGFCFGFFFSIGERINRSFYTDLHNIKIILVFCWVQGLESFLDQCRKCGDVYLLPNQQILTPAGGQLVHTLAEHTKAVSGLAMTSDGQYVITCAYPPVSL